MAKKLWVGGDGSGINDWSVAANWSPSGVPADGDDVYLRNSSVGITASLDQSAVTLASLTIDMTFTGAVGTASAYLQIGASAFRCGDPSLSASSGSGSGRIKIDFGSVQTAATVVNTSNASTDSGLEPVRLIGTHASNALTVLSGRVGIGTTLAGEVATFAIVNIAGKNAILTLAAGCTLTTINQSDGILNLLAAATTVNQSGGTLTTSGIGAIATANIGGTANLNSSGMITTVNVQKGGYANLSGSPTARTITNCSLYNGAKLNASNGNPLSITFTNGVDLVQCGFPDVTLDFGDNLTVTPSAL